MTDASASASLTLLLDQVACRRGGRLLFEGLSDRVAPGELLWLRGSNGRGKSSLLRMAAGLAPPESGRILWGGEPVHRSLAYANDRLYIAHANGLKDDLSAAEALAFLARLQGRDAAPGAVAGALARLGLAARARAPVRTLSQGQRRRVALARLALSPAARLWILDEPFDALDTASAAVLHTLLDSHRAAGGSVLLTSHHLPLAATVAGVAPSPPRLLELDALAVGESAAAAAVAA